MEYLADLWNGDRVVIGGMVCEKTGESGLGAGHLARAQFDDRFEN